MLSLGVNCKIITIISIHRNTAAGMIILINLNYSRATSLTLYCYIHSILPAYTKIEMSSCRSVIRRLASTSSRVSTSTSQVTSKATSQVTSRAQSGGVQSALSEEMMVPQMPPFGKWRENNYKYFWTWNKLLTLIAGSKLLWWQIIWVYANAQRLNMEIMPRAKRV